MFLHIPHTCENYGYPNYLKLNLYQIEFNSNSHNHKQYGKILFINIWFFEFFNKWWKIIIQQSTHMTINVAQMTTWIWSGRSYVLILLSSPYTHTHTQGIGVLSNPSLATQHLVCNIWHNNKWSKVGCLVLQAKLHSIRWWMEGLMDLCMYICSPKCRVPHHV